jgi:type IV pilus assembly protein PilV
MKTRQSGIALLEALIAVMILGIGLLGTIGLQARAFSALSDAGMRAEATIASEKLLGIMSNDLPNAAQYGLAAGAVPTPVLSDWYNETRSAIPGAVIAVTVGAPGATDRTQVDIVISWTRDAGKAPNSQATTAYIAQAM